MGVFNRLGYNFDSTKFGSGDAFTAGQAKLLNSGSSLKTWQALDLVNVAATGYFQNPHTANLTTLTVLAESLLANSNTTSITFTYASDSANNLYLAANNVLNEIPSFTSHTNRLSGVTASTDGSTLPDYQMAMAVGRQVLALTNQIDGMQNNAPLLGNFTSLAIGGDIANTIILLNNDLITLNNSISLGESSLVSNITSSSMNTIVAHVQSAYTLLNGRRTSDVNFYVNSLALVNDYNKVSQFNVVGVNSNYLINTLNIGTDKLKTYLQSNAVIPTIVNSGITTTTSTSSTVSVTSDGLSPTGISAGIYTNPIVQFDTYGRAIYAESCTSPNYVSTTINTIFADTVNANLVSNTINVITANITSANIVSANIATSNTTLANITLTNITTANIATINFRDGTTQITNTSNTLINSGYTYPVKLMNTDDQNTAYRHAFVIMSDGSVMGWGYDQTYTLGDGSTGINRKFPVQVGFPPSFPGAFEVHTAHNLSSACIDVNGQLWMWGRNDYGSCGVGTATNVKSPVNVSLIASNSIYGKTIKQVAYPCGIEGVDFVLVLCTDGTVHACGYNGYGQCGNGNTTNQSYFVRCGTLTGVTQISSGRERYTTCGAVTGGALYVWGYNGDYNLGNGNTTSNVYSPQLRSNGSLSGKTVTKFGASRLTMYALCSDGTLHGWGNAVDGQLGLGNRSAQTTPAQLNTNVASMQTAAYEYTIVTILKNDGTAYYAGNESYILPYTIDNGDDTYSQNITNLWYQLTGYTGTIQKIVHGGTGSYNFIHLLMTDGSVWAYGYNGNGQLGVGNDQTNFPNGTNIAGTNGYAGPVLVKCDAVADIGTYGDGSAANIMLLTRRNKIKISGTQGDWAHGLGVDNNVYVPSPLNLS